MRDLFEDLRNLLGCDYVSDIRFALGRGRALMAVLNLELYPLDALEDAAAYLFGEKPEFADYPAARRFFCGRPA